MDDATSHPPCEMVDLMDMRADAVVQTFAQAHAAENVGLARALLDVAMCTRVEFFTHEQVISARTFRQKDHAEDDSEGYNEDWLLRGLTDKPRAFEAKLVYWKRSDSGGDGPGGAGEMTVSAANAKAEASISTAFSSMDFSKLPVPKVAMYRLLGNDMPPLQSMGQIRWNLKYTLDNEGPLEGIERKRWVVNRIVNETEEKLILELLESYGYTKVPSAPLSSGIVAATPRRAVTSSSFRSIGRRCSRGGPRKITRGPSPSSAPSMTHATGC
mmetsp:Transcript_39545/g.126158  ORF Transcript_39545/g.126158 Transcript_39545/m.126158 type:complete len:271 (-) Transcript_39545:1129-1941(-)